MSNSTYTEQIEIQLLGRTYKLACSAEEKETLQQAADLLGNEMREIREQSRTFGSERIAIMAALNIAHELVRINAQHNQLKDKLSQNIQQLHLKASAVLAEMD
ncbi:MAG: hypothetical protein AXA67_00640 [Methylothermaceae bacteria B42]|nr:MAG: hypothetical protein AXA67_00640 [Methylothermaceae bacteria B42]HHJ38778.1 cell division protein ZapA [Methylothermaceae bacterium]